MKFKQKHLPFPPKNPSSDHKETNDAVCSTILTRCYRGWCDPSCNVCWLALPELSLLLFPWAAKEKWDVSLQREVLNIWVAWGTNGSLTPKTNNHSAWGQWELSLCIKTAELTVTQYSSTQVPGPSTGGKELFFPFNTLPLASKDFHK